MDMTLEDPIVMAEGESALKLALANKDGSQQMQHNCILARCCEGLPPGPFTIRESGEIQVVIGCTKAAMAWVEYYLFARRMVLRMHSTKMKGRFSGNLARVYWK